MDEDIFIYDLETTSANVKEARIVQFSYALREFDSGELIEEDTRLVNPGVPISAEAAEVHGIRNEDVADEPGFDHFAGQFKNILDRDDVIICGFNNRRFDDIILENEFRRIGQQVDLSQKPVIDVFKFYKKHYPATLEGVVAHILREKMKNAHDASSDMNYTYRVFSELLERHQASFPDQADGINRYLYPGYVDRDGKLRWKDGKAVFSFGKHKDKALQTVAADAPGYLQWICSADFSNEFKQICRSALQGSFPAKTSGKQH